MNSGKIVAGGWTDGTGEIEGSTRGPRGPKKFSRLLTEFLGDFESSFPLLESLFHIILGCHRHKSVFAKKQHISHIPCQYDGSGRLLSLDQVLISVLVLPLSHEKEI